MLHRQSSRLLILRLLSLLLRMLLLMHAAKTNKKRSSNGFGPGLISGAARLQHTAAPCGSAEEQIKLQLARLAVSSSNEDCMESHHRADSALQLQRAVGSTQHTSASPTRDLSRFVKWPRYIRIQRQRKWRVHTIDRHIDRACRQWLSDCLFSLRRCKVGKLGCRCSTSRALNMLCTAQLHCCVTRQCAALSLRVTGSASVDALVCCHTVLSTYTAVVRTAA
eukprot:13186-Heterococcus_DN1.PRE.1